MQQLAHMNRLHVNSDHNQIKKDDKLIDSRKLTKLSDPTRSWSALCGQQNRFSKVLQPTTITRPNISRFSSQKFGPSFFNWMVVVDGRFIVALKLWNVWSGIFYWQVWSPVSIYCLDRNYVFCSIFKPTTKSQSRWVTASPKSPPAIKFVANKRSSFECFRCKSSSSVSLC